MLGKKIQQYQFVEKLGAGGMGEIYKALDTRLNRTVAIKVLPSAKSGDPERRRRFLQEAQSASGLNHPSIITIHDVISDGDTEYMVMEYVQGKTLNDLIPKEGLRVPQAVKYGLQMADALAAAHAAGIIHRDLKPANVMVTDNGFVKILDFGLAKLTDRTAELHDNTQTMGAPLTMEGAILGTVSYMSPEQAQGMKLDTRSDIFSFGAVMFEMVTGRRAFEGGSSLSTLSSILRDETTPMTALAPDTPPDLEAVIQRCLRKNPDDRWRTMRDVQGALSPLKRDSDSGSLYTQTVQTRVAPPTMVPPTIAQGMGQAGPAPSLAPPPAAGATASSFGLSPKMAIGLGAAIALLLGGGIGTYSLIKQSAGRAAKQAAAAQPIPVPQVQPEPVSPPPAPVKEVMDNSDVLQMVAAKVPTELILSQIRNAGETKFEFATEDIIALSKSGVPGPVIEQMRNPKRTLAPAVVAAANAAAASAAANGAKNPKQDKGVPATAVPEAPKTTPTLAPAAVQAEEPKPVPVPAPVVRAPEVHTVALALSDSLPFKITLTAEIPNDADLGRPIRFTATEDFRVNGTVVIPKGAGVTGEISETPKKKRFGFGGGRLSFKLTKADTAGGGSVNVRALAAKSSDGNTQREVAKGRLEYIGYIDGEQHVNVPQK